MSGNEIVYQTSAETTPTRAEQTAAIYNAQTTVNVCSKYIVARENNNNGIAQVT